MTWEFWITAAMIPGAFLVAGGIVFVMATWNQHKSH